MALAHVNFFSSVLEKQVAMNVILPESGKPPFGVFYLLHGLSDDHNNWIRNTSIERYVSGLPLIVVMPDGFRSFYTKPTVGPDFGKYISEEIPAFVERNFPARTTGRARCIGGLSMGGYGALRTALANPGRYVSVNSHSGVTIASYRAGSDPKSEMNRIFGKDASGTQHDLIHLAKRAKAKRNLPKILIDCGTDDFLIKENRHYHDELTRLKIPHEYREYPGDHNWGYWDLHVREAIAFHMKALG